MSTKQNAGDGNWTSVIAVPGFVFVATAQVTNMILARGLAGSVPPFTLAFFRGHAAQDQGRRPQVRRRSSRLAVGGGSAGGNLAAVMAQRAPSAFKAQLLSYGVLGNSFDTASYLHFGDRRFGLSRDRMKMHVDLYVGKDGDTDDPAITPMNGDLKSTPPAWICAAECDVLHDDSVQFYEKLRALRSGDQSSWRGPHPRLHQPRPAPTAGEDDDRECGGVPEGEGLNGLFGEGGRAAHC